MRLLHTFLFFLVSFSAGFAQTGFHIQSNKNKIVIPFQLIHNLIFIPITVNGEELTFLLDTGVEESILFSLEDKEAVSFFDVKKIKLKGLGSSEPIEALKSSKNKLEVNGFVDNNHEIYIILDQEFNFSSQVGIPVNGIIGFHFFKNNLVEINYANKKIVVYENSKKLEKRIRRNYFTENITLENNKPYLISEITFDQESIPSKLLLDTGNSDALWVFLNKSSKFYLPKVTVSDYLGRGFSGNVYGVRGRISNFKFGNKKFENPIATFPDTTSTKDVKMVKDRVGSFGGEILKRFTVIFDYRKLKIHTKENANSNNPFIFNMSGVDIQHD